MKYPAIVQTAWNELNSFAKDFQSNPYYWWTEMDIVIDICRRLNTRLVKLSCHQFVANYPDSLPQFQGNQVWNRLSCTPLVTYKYKDGKQYRCKPDIVIWDPDKIKPSTPPDISDYTFPILWACEVKYNNYSKNKWDIEKLGYLLEQDRARYGCWLMVYQKNRITKPGIEWEKGKFNNRLWSGKLYVPQSKPKEHKWLQY